MTAKVFTQENTKQNRTYKINTPKC